MTKGRKKLKRIKKKCKYQISIAFKKKENIILLSKEENEQKLEISHHFILHPAGWGCSLYIEVIHINETLYKRKVGKSEGNI